MLALLATIAPAPPACAAGTTYYVSSSDGNDSNAGTSEASPFRTIAKVNALALQPGDRVLFKCGDTWRGGHHMVFSNNIIDGANHFGITGYFAESTFEDNTIRNIALIRNLGKSGMGCGITSGECTENGQ